MPILDISTQLSDYRGLLIWNAFTDGAGISRPSMTVELFIKAHPIPLRRPKITELVQVSQLDPLSNKETSFGGLFFGQPDILQLQLSGWIITPANDTAAWTIKDSAGNPALLGNITYTDVITNYLSGFYNLSSGGAPQRKDPDAYVDPYGHRYEGPVIAIWEPSYTPNIRKQAFNMTLYLEK